MLIDGAPQQGRFSAQRHDYLVQVPGRSRLAPCAHGAMRKARPELVAPAPDRLLADDNAALKQQLLDSSARIRLKPPGVIVDGPMQRLRLGSTKSSDFSAACLIHFCTASRVACVISNCTGR
jgi:hypothetical protein